MTNASNILVIRLSAFGDIIRSFSTMAAIRATHPAAKITLLTTKPYEEITRRSPYFDDVWVTPRLKWHQLGDWWQLRRQLKNRGFDRVYDLQRNDRTRILRHLAPRPLQKQWFDKTLPLPGYNMDHWDILQFPAPDASWLEGDTSRFALPAPYILIVPGCAPQHPHKRWPAAHYAALTKALQAEGYTVAALGTAAEAGIIREIAAAAPSLCDLSSQTSFFDIAALARKAAGAVGNDTGPMHLVALAGCPVVSLFSGTTNPAQSRPLGRAVHVLQAEPIGGIAPDAVKAALAAAMADTRINPV